MSNKIRVSIVIPCYNHGEYIEETIASVEKYPDKSVYEIIIVNDGSTDSETIETLKKLEEKGYFVLNQKNTGLADARNNGVKLAKGDYILPLDSDNMIRPDYIKYGIEIMDKNPKVGMVYGDAQLFGIKVGIRRAGKYSRRRQFVWNAIDACAVIRKSALEEVGGYDKNMPHMGYEDWNFVISLNHSKWELRYVNKILYDYRVGEESMLTDADEKRTALLNYMNANNIESFREEYIDMLKQIDGYIEFKESVRPLFSQLIKNTLRKVGF